MSAIPPEAWGVIGLSVGALLQYLSTRSTNAATISQQKRQSERDDLALLLSVKDAEIARLREDNTTERERTAFEQARADRYLTQLLADEQLMHRAAAAMEQQDALTGGAP